jgi:hypothetical protein
MNDSRNESGAGFILNIVAIIVVLGIVFLSQSGSFTLRGASGQAIQEKTGSYWSQAVEWVKAQIYPRVSSEVEKRGGELAQKVEEQKNNFAQNIWDGIKSYLQKNFNYLLKSDVK